MEVRVSQSVSPPNQFESGDDLHFTSSLFPSFSTFSLSPTFSTFSLFPTFSRKKTARSLSSWYNSSLHVSHRPIHSSPSNATTSTKHPARFTIRKITSNPPTGTPDLSLPTSTSTLGKFPVYETRKLVISNSPILPIVSGVLQTPLQSLFSAWPVWFFHFLVSNFSVFCRGSLPDSHTFWGAS